LIEWFKSKPSWLKGGLALLSIYIFFAILVVIIFSIGGEFGMFGVPILFTLMAPFLIITKPLASLIGINQVIIGIPISIVGYFLIGCLIGLIISKIKSK